VAIDCAAHKKAIYAYLLLVSLFAISGAQAPKRFERVDSLAVSLMSCMVQDRDGIFWIGATNGLYKWDGKRTTMMNSGNSGFPAALTNALLVDHGGTIWVAMNGMGIVSYDKVTDTYGYYRKDPKDPNSISSDMIGQGVFLTDALDEDIEGGIWIATAGSGICRIDPSRKRVDRYQADPRDPGSLPSDQAFSLEAASSGDLWVGTNAGLSLLRKGERSFKTYRHDPADTHSLSDDTVTAIVEDSGRRVWIATKNGLNRYDPAKDRFDAFMAGPGGLSANNINTMAEDRNGNLWLGHLHARGGVSVLDTRTLAIERYLKGGGAFGISGDSVRHIAVDNDGVVWLVEELGNSRYDYDYQPEISSLRLLQPKDGSRIPHFTFAVIQARKNLRLLFGYSPNCVQAYDVEKRTLELYPLSNKNGPRLFFCGLADPDGTLWIFDSSGFINRVAPGAMSVSGEIKVTNTMGFALVQDPKEADILWLGTQGDGLAKISKSRGSVVKYKYLPGDPTSLSSNTIRHALAFDSENPNILYVGSLDGGLDLFDTSSGKVRKTFKHDENDPKSISNDSCGSMIVTSKGEVWITTANALNHLDKATGTFTRYSSAYKNFPGDSVSAILEDDSGCLWVSESTMKAIIKFDPSTGKCKSFDKSMGFDVGMACPYGTIKDTDGKLWFPGELGAAFFDPEKLKDNDYKPNVLITGLYQAGVGIKVGSAYELVKEIRLPWDMPFFEFEAASLSYRAPESNRYRFKLEGVDKDWYEAGFDNKGRYSGLRGGNYTLKVMGSNNDGLWSDKIAMVRIRVASPFWRTWWFYALIGLALIMFAGFMVGQRIRKLKAEGQVKLLRKEMELARHIQTALLPKDMNLHPELRIFALMLTAEEVGGDYFDVQEGDSGSLWISIGDVSGHGLTPGLIMMIAQNTLATIVSDESGKKIDAVDLVVKVNRQVYANVHERLGSDNFMTFNAIKYSSGGRLAFAGAHMPILVYRESTGTGEEHETRGTWLNLVPEISGALVKGEFELGIGDTMVVYTDGITEAFGAKEEMFGISRLKDSIALNIGKTVEEIGKNVLDDVLAWSGGVKTDDMTVVVVRRVV
jgi:ligand-binding sensor domain-containing protein